MFAFSELDKLLKDVAADDGRRKQRHINFPEVGRIEVEKLVSKLGSPFSLTSKPQLIPKSNSSRVPLKLEFVSRQARRFSTDITFAIKMNDLLSPVLNKSYERPYPTAKLILCDDISLELLSKFQRILSSGLFIKNSTEFRNFLYKSPHNITALFPIKNIIDLLDQTPAPKLIKRIDRSTGKTVMQLNYPLIQKEFPYLKLTDLIIILLDRKRFELNDRNPDSNEPRMTLQFLEEFSRSTKLVELVGLLEQTGRVHPVYDNVLTFAPRLELANLKMTFNMLSSVAEQVTRLTAQLGLRLSSLSYRYADPAKSCELLCRLISSNLSTPVEREKRKRLKPARVLILDRFIDLQGYLLHPDLYGPYLEQEYLSQDGENWRSFVTVTDPVDELDEILQLCPLNETLNVLMKQASGLRYPEPTDRRWTTLPAMMIMSSSQCIMRHLAIIKDLYKTLDRGYLLLLRLESSLLSVTDHLRGLSEAPDFAKQEEFALRLQRVYQALKQLAKGSVEEKSYGSMSLLRVACLLLDAINIFLYITATEGMQSKKANALVSSIRRSVFGKFKKLLDTKPQTSELRENKNHAEKLLNAFDKVSRDTCKNRSSLKLEAVLEGFVNSELGEQFYPCIRIEHDEKERAKELVVLLFLGPLTPHELSEVKVVEQRLGAGQILIMCADIWHPALFLNSLLE